jgi:hypoxanthine phosphoribosyltransferase
MTLSSNKTKVRLELPYIKARLKAQTLPKVDGIIGISTGGTAPAALVAYELDLPLFTLAINYRAEDNKPQRDNPELLEPLPLELPQHLLLVDDVSVTGQTLELAKKLLYGHTVTTLVFKGKGDIVLFPEIANCVHWPWKAS